MSSLPAILFVICIMAALLSGFPVAFALVITSLAYALLAALFGVFDPVLLYAIPSRIYGVMTNQVLVAVPLFVLMGMVLQKSRLAEDMFGAVMTLFSRSTNGMMLSVTVVGVLLAASTGIVGASVVMLGLLGLPVLLRAGVPLQLASGGVAAAGTLGQIIPPSIVLIVLGDQMSNAYQVAQTKAGNFAPQTVTVADLFAGALVPGLLLAGLFVVYQLWRLRGVRSTPQEFADADAGSPTNMLSALILPLGLILAVLGSILTGVATPTEAAALGALLSMFLGLIRERGTGFLMTAVAEAVHLTAMIFVIVIAASIFALVFRGLGGDALVEGLVQAMPGGTYGALLGVMLLIFVLGFFLEFLEITYMVVPLVAPILLALPMADGSAMSPVWLGVLIAINLQTSFMTPPFGVALFYLRGVVPETVATTAIYCGVVPYIGLQMFALGLVMVFPALAQWLPDLLLGR
ncbi:MAG: TRAP transporter large permease subunit [Ahrensia sp.]|nr:TRAP transporter large permease subunit [Ahrensia sp.]